MVKPHHRIDPRFSLHNGLWLIAHRGGAKEVMENSMEGVSHAISIGCQSVELDLRATKDGQIVVLHDATLDRTTDGKGKLKNYTLQQLKSIRLKNGERIPTLSQILKRTKGKIFLHLEVKETGWEEALVKTIKKFRMEKSVCVISFLKGVLHKIAKIDPKISTGYIFEHPVSLSSIPRECSLLLPKSSLLKKPYLKKLEQTSKPIHAWVIDTPSEAKRLIPQGIRGIITDIPEALLLADSL